MVHDMAGKEKGPSGEFDRLKTNHPLTKFKIKF